MGGQTPEDAAQIVVGVASDRQAAQAQEAAPLFQLARGLGQKLAEIGQRKVVAAEARPVEAARLHRGQRPIDLSRRAGGQMAEPVGLAQLRAAPGAGALNRRSRRRRGRAHARTRVLSGS
jgi:hypothetical protein